MSVEWFLKLKEIDSLTKMKTSHLKIQIDQSLRVTKLNDRLQAAHLQTATLNKMQQELRHELSEVEIKLKTASDQKQRIIDIGGDSEKISLYAEEISRLEERGIEILNSQEETENELSETKVFISGLMKTIQEIQNEIDPENASILQEIKNLDLRISLLFEELPSDFKSILNKITAKNLANGPFTRIEQGSCYLCRYKISRLEESEIDMLKSLKNCPQCSRIFLPYGS